MDTTVIIVNPQTYTDEELRQIIEEQERLQPLVDWVTEHPDITERDDKHDH